MTAECSIEGCGRPLSSTKLGLCLMHQLRLERHGDVNIVLTQMRDRGSVSPYTIVDDKTATIPLTRGYEATVDLEDIPSLIQHLWYFFYDGRRHKAARTKINGKGIYMHNFLLPPEEGKVTDHINGDALDNRKSNLRKVSLGENARNSDKVRNAVGMTFNKREGKWKAYTPGLQGRKQHLGTFSSREDAEAAVKAYRDSQKL